MPLDARVRSIGGLFFLHFGLGASEGVPKHGRVRLFPIVSLCRGWTVLQAAFLATFLATNIGTEQVAQTLTRPNISQLVRMADNLLTSFPLAFQGACASLLRYSVVLLTSCLLSEPHLSGFGLVTHWGLLDEECRRP